jgi:hypothetical protein
MPVLVYERVKTTQHLYVFKRYRNNLLFAGSLNLLGILLIGLTGYWYIMGTRYASFIYDELLAVMGTAKLDYDKYKVLEWFQRKNRLEVYVTREIPD